MNKIITLLFILVSCTIAAQVTAIPDPAFEQELINQNIDSDGIINGQVLTSDVETVTELNISDNDNVIDLTGIQGFTNLEELLVNFTGITELDVSQNTQLKILNCRSNLLTSIDISQNILLEKLYVGNVGDIGPWNEITEIDLSNNPNINTVDASINQSLETINLRNGNNNSNMRIELIMWEGEGPPNPGLNVPVCVQVDDEEAAQNNQLPYSDWEILEVAATVTYSENCALSTQNFPSDNTISVYPNPTSGILYFSAANGVSVDSAVLYDISGRMVKEYKDVSAGSISVAGLAKGMYVVQLFSGNTTQTKKIIVE